MLERVPTPVFDRLVKGAVNGNSFHETTIVTSSAKKSEFTWRQLGMQFKIVCKYSQNHHCVCLLACLQPYTVNFKWAHLNFNITKIELGVRSLKPAVNAIVLQARIGYLGWDDWSWSNLLPVYCRSSTACCSQAVQIRSRQWLRSLQARAMRKRHL